MAGIFHRIPKEKGPTGLSQRQLRAGEVLRKAIAEILQRWDGWSQAFTSSMVTITRVQLTADLRHATVFVAPLDGTDTKEFVGALTKIVPALQKRLATKVSLKFLPLLRFKIDEAFDQAERLERLFRDPKVQQDLIQETP